MLEDTFQSFQATINATSKNKQLIKPYVYEYYNVQHASRTDPNDRVVTRTFNSIVDLTNERKRMPRFLVVVLDKNVIEDINVFSSHAVQKIRDEVHWLVRQISIFMRRKRAEINSKHPGAVYANNPVVIFVRMINRKEINVKPKSAREKIFSLRSKFNEVLNESAAENDHRILTINTCKTRSHFDHKGNLSEKGKTAFWEEIDDLLYRFDDNGIKLLPNPVYKRPHTTEN